jgi:GTP-binding protein
VIFSSRPEALPGSYLRYLVNDLKKTFGLGPAPVRMHVRKTKNPYADEEERGKR